MRRDPSAVLFDALQAAKARKVDYVSADTAGRLHTKSNLMAELDKMRRTATRVIPGSPHEVLLVVDATTGQNGLEQARRFTETSGVTGIVRCDRDISDFKNTTVQGIGRPVIDSTAVKRRSIRRQSAVRYRQQGLHQEKGKSDHPGLQCWADAIAGSYPGSVRE